MKPASIQPVTIPVTCSNYTVNLHVLVLIAHVSVLVKIMVTLGTTSTNGGYYGWRLEEIPQQTNNISTKCGSPDINSYNYKIDNNFYWNDQGIFRQSIPTVT